MYEENTKYRSNKKMVQDTHNDKKITGIYEAIITDILWDNEAKRLSFKIRLEYKNNGINDFEKTIHIFKNYHLKSKKSFNRYKNDLKKFFDFEDPLDAKAIRENVIGNYVTIETFFKNEYRQVTFLDIKKGFSTGNKKRDTSMDGVMEDYDYRDELKPPRSSRIKALQNIKLKNEK